MEKFIGSIDHTLPEELVKELKARDVETKKRQWATFEEKLPSNAKAVTEAFKSFYELYDEGLVKWMANLFDPDICVCNEVYGKTVCEHHPLCGTAGWHYTHSARDNVGFMPVVEAMNSVYDFVESCGITDEEHILEYFGEEFGKKMMAFVTNLQDPDGYFYHPQWGKEIPLGRKGRDFDRALILLGRYGMKPKYPTIKDVMEGNASQDTAIPDNLKTLDAFKAYMDSLDIEHRSYHAGSYLGSQFTQIKARGQEYIDALFEFFDSHQKENGIWSDKADYYASNGLMKIACNYSAGNRPFPRADKAIKAAVDAILSPEDPDSIVTVWNPWVSLKRLFANIEQFQSPEKVKELRAQFLEMAPEAIRITKEKTAKFRKPDGSFSYLQEYATWTMGGSPCGVPRTVEGDMDAGVLGTNSMVWVIACVLGMEEYGVPIYGEYEGAMFKNIMENRKPVRKV